MSKIGDGAKDEAAHIANIRNESDKANADFGLNPEGWRDFDSWRDKALGQNRASAARVSF